MKLRIKREGHAEQAAQPPAAGEAPQTNPDPPAEENKKTAEATPAATPDGTQLLSPPQPHPAEERLIRLRADFDNMRKRFERDRQEMTILSNERLIRELLPVVDHLELALNAAAQHKTEKAVQDGFKLVYDQLYSTLNGFGLKPLDAQGKVFDPNFHEAIAQQHSNEVPEHVVIVQTRRGYQLGDRLLRPAQVIVSGGPAQAATTPPKE